MLILIKVTIGIGLSVVVFGAGYIYGLVDARKIINKEIERERIREIKEKEAEKE